MSRQHKIRLSREGWVYLVVLGFILGGAVMREVNLLFVLAGMLAGPLILSFRSAAKTLRNLQVSRTVPQGVCAGDAVVVHVCLHNHRRRLGGFAVAVEDRIVLNTSTAASHEVYFPYVAAGCSRQKSYHGRLQRRGRYHVGPVRLSTAFPFGLVRGEMLNGGTDSLLIYPRIGRLTRLWTARHHEAFEGGRWQRQRYHRSEGEYYGVREWRDGDSRRSIHWRSSARLGQLVVRQFEQPHARDIALLIDLWSPPRGTPEDLQRVERVISFAATVVADICRQGSASLLLATSGADPCVLSGSVSSGLLQQAMQQLAVCQPGGEDSLHVMLEAVIAEIGSAAEIVLLSTRLPDLTGSRPLAELWCSAPRRALLRRIQIISDVGRGHGDFIKADAAANGNVGLSLPVNALSRYFRP